MIEAFRTFWHCFFSDDRPAAQVESAARPRLPVAQPQDDDFPPSSIPLSGLTAKPIVSTLQAELGSRAKELTMPELVDVIRFIDATLATRDAAPSPLVVMQILDMLDRVYARSATRVGMAIPVLRAELGDVPRAAFDRALLAIEARGRVELIAGDPRSPFIEPLEGIDVFERGLLYFVKRKDRR
jgi:hypothetical protein